MQIVELKVNVEKSQLEALAAEVEKLNGKVINFKTSTGGTGGASPTAGINKGLKETSQQAEKTGQSIMSVVGKVAKWTAVTTAVYAPVKAFKEALGTLKEVDSQLVQVQKVTNFSQRQMKEIEQQAYKTASAYGVSADKYTESVAAFARAGYKEQSAGLAELSTKTQLVGDTTAEVANQFLLSTDAAYKYNGSVQQLSRVLDGANQLDNNYATSIEKIAEGMGLVAPVAAQAGIGVDELMASLGTITAVTQRSGAEAARAYRALVLNILGDTKTEIADGATWTAGEIEGLRDVLKTYAPEAVKAAEATGDIINPMKAMEGLSQAMKDGVLTEQKLMEMVSDIGGKLRTSQLLALIQNWDMYESMLKDFQNAAGSADKEVENAMNSWERKTEVLKNTWTEFVSHMVDTDLIKGGLDAVTGFVEVLDSGFGQAAIKVAAITAAFAGLSKVIGGIASSKFVGVLKDIPVFLAAFGDIAKGQGLVAALGQVLGMLGPIGVAAATIAGIVGAIKLADFLDVDYDEQISKVKELKDEYEGLYGKEGELQALEAKQKSDEGLSGWEQSRLQYLRDYRKELEQNIELEKQAALERYKREYGSESADSGHKFTPNHEDATGHNDEAYDVRTLKEAQKAFDALTASVKDGSKSRAEAKDEMQGLLDTYKDFYEEIQTGIDLGAFELEDLDPATQDMMRLYDTMKALVDLPVEEWGIGSAIMQFDQLAEVGDKSVYNLQAFEQALADAGASAEDIEGTITQLQSDDNVILIDVEAENIDSTIDSLKELGIATEEAGQTKVNVDEFAKLADQIGLSKEQATDLANQMDKAGASLVDAEGNAANLETAFEGVGSPIQNLTDNVKNLVDTLREINGLDPEVNVDTNADEVKDDVASVENSVESIDGTTANADIGVNDNATPMIEIAEAEASGYANGNYTASVDAMDNASGVINSVKGQATGYAKPYTATLKAIDNASSVIRGAVSALAGFVSKTIHLTTVHNNVYTGAASSDLKHATGALNFRGGPTLLGDELSPDGSPRPELVITKNGAFIAGMSGPVMTSLPAGSRIFKYSDTMDILSGGDLSELQAFSAGNNRALDAWKNRNSTPASSASSSTSKPSTSTSSSGSSRSSSSSGSGGSSGSSRSSGRSGGRSGGSSSSSGGGGSSIDTLKEELELLESQYSFLEASNASTEELWAKSDEIKAKLHQINDTLRSTGGKQKDIVDYSTKWWQEVEKQRGLLEDDLSLLEAQYSFLEESGASAEDLNAKSAEIQDKLHEINELARATGGNQKDILATSQKWWSELKKIHEVQRKVYQDERELLQSQSDLMEHQNKSAGERIAKLREIQDNLHQEAEYMRSIKADQAEINQLSIQWWEVQEQILQIQKDLAESLDATVRARLRQIGDEKDDAIKTIRDQIKEIEKERDSKLKELIEVKYKDLELNRDDLDLEQAKLDAQEKRNKLLEAEQNLRNAMNDRSVRYYNAATGQWEWGADAKKVKQAQEELERAKQDKDDGDKNVRQQEYELEKKRLEDDYDKRIQAKEDQIDKLTDEFDDLDKEWERMYDRMFGEALGDIENILQQMLDTGVITDAQAQEIRAFWNKINGFAGSIDLTTSEILKTLKSWKQFQEEMPEATPSEYINYLTDFLNENGWSDENYNAAVSMAKAMAGETGASSQLAILAARKAKADAGYDPYDQGYDKPSSGGAAAAAAKAVSDAVSNSGGSNSSSSSISSSKPKTVVGAIEEGSIFGQILAKSGKYDSGGILNGFGGIKATARDEIVIPPDLAEYMLKPSASKTFQNRVSELAYLYGSKPIPGALSNNRSSNDHYGDTYTFGNVTLTEDKARTTTVYELAQMSRSLGIYRNG